jgi:prepilin-type N-terminal cleavage/methylation domain-containing protein
MAITKKTNGLQAGFTLVETMVAMVVLAIGLMSVATVFSSSLEIIALAQCDAIAQHQAQQMIEGIFAARNTGAIAFAALQNQSSAPGIGIFKDGMTAAFQAGADGVMNTLDDGPALEIGPDGRPLANFQRQIVISTVLLQDGVSPDPNQRKVQVWVQYTMGRMVRSYTQVTYVSTFR